MLWRHSRAEPSKENLEPSVWPFTAFLGAAGANFQWRLWYLILCVNLIGPQWAYKHVLIQTLFYIFFLWVILFDLMFKSDKVKQAVLCEREECANWRPEQRISRPSYWWDNPHCLMVIKLGLKNKINERPFDSNLNKNSSRIGLHRSHVFGSLDCQSFEHRL